MCEVISIGTGCLMRALLLPVLEQVGWRVIACQPRGTDVVDALRAANGAYTYYVVQPDGTRDEHVVRNVVGALALARPPEHEEFLRLPQRYADTLRAVAIGVTEPGLADNSPAINLLAEILLECQQHLPADRVLSVINTDNLARNGPTIRDRVRTCDTIRQRGSEAFLTWLESNTVFHVTMVDRVTVAQPDSHVPLTEPMPPRAFVIDDVCGTLPTQLAHVPGVVVRATTEEVERDHNVKFLVLNAGAHTALAAALGVTGLPAHNPALAPRVFTTYARTFLKQCVLPLVEQRTQRSRHEIRQQFDAFWHRLRHPFFSMHPLWICRNPLSKLESRLLVLAQADLVRRPRALLLLALAVAAMLRMMTPKRATTVGSKSSAGSLQTGTFEVRVL